LVVGYRLTLFLADLLVADRRRVLAVQQVEMQGMLRHGADHAHRDRDETEGDRPGPDRTRHRPGLPDPHVRLTRQGSRLSRWLRCPGPIARASGASPSAV